MNTKTFIPLAEAARRLRIPWRDVINLIHAGRLRARLLGHRWWVERTSLNALHAQRYRRTPPEQGAA